MRPLLVGESNPYGSDPRFALWPDPPGCAGWRLCHLVIDLPERDYLRAYERVNLCAGPWRLSEARATASGLHAQARGGGVLVLLGAKVCLAFNRAFDPFVIERDPGLGLLIVRLPHPSGLSRAWNAPRAYRRARAVLREAGCHVGAEP